MLKISTRLANVSNFRIFRTPSSARTSERLEVSKLKQSTFREDFKPTSKTRFRDSGHKTYLTNKTLLNPSLRRHFSAPSESELRVTVQDGLFKLTVPLPSTKENCLFSVRPDQTVKNLLLEMKEEDPSIDRVSVYSTDGARISSSTPLEHVLKSNFQLVLNDTKYRVTSSKQPTAVSATKATQAVETTDPVELDDWKKEIIPLLIQKKKMDERAHRYANFVIFGGLGFLICQWSFLARLTWWSSTGTLWNL